MMYDPSYNFYEVVDKAEKHFAGIDKDAKGSGWKPFQRWKFNNEYKYYPDGVRSNVDPYFAKTQYQKFLKNNPTQKTLFNGNWRELGPSTIDSITGHYSAGLGRVEDLYIDPTDSNRIYLGSRSGGFWRSIDGGQNWVVTTDSLFATGVNAFAVSPSNSDSVLINVRNARNGTSHGIYKSTNGGLNWTTTNFNPIQIGFGGLGTNFQVNVIKYHPGIPNLVFVGTNQGLFRSTDNLNSSTRLLAGYNINQIAFHPQLDSIIYLYDSGTPSAANSPLRSTDLGNSFSIAGIASGNSNRNVRLSTSPDCADCLYFASDNGVWKSVNRGSSFTYLSNPNEVCRAFSVSDIDTSIMIYGYVDLENSTDGGKNFTRRTRWSLGNTNGSGNGNAISYRTSTNYIHADLRNSICVNGVFYVATDGFLCKSSDGGVNWQILSEGTGIRENYRLGVAQGNHGNVICGSQDNGTSIFKGSSWLEFYGADGMEGIIHPLNDDWLIGSVQFGNRQLSKNGGTSRSGASPSGSSSADWVAPLAYSHENSMELYDFRDYVYYSPDFSESHIRRGTPNFSGNIQRAAVAFNNSDMIVVSRGGSLERSMDGGNTFSNIRTGTPNYMIEDIAIDPKNDSTIIVVFGRYQNDGQKVYISQNMGLTWTNITYNLGNMPIRSVVIDHTDQANIYLGAEIGVFTKPMNGTTWSLYNPGLPNVSILELDINYGSNTLRAASWGRGLWEYSLVGRSNYPAILRTSITDTPREDAPKYSVDQYVYSAIQYSGNLSSVYLKWSNDTTSLGNRIDMSLVGGQWESNQAIPTFPAGTIIYFKVYAVGSNNDTTESYRFNYEVKPFDYCAASGNTSSGNLFINRMILNGVTKVSGNNGYSLSSTPLIDLYADSSYQLEVSANTSWSGNDYAAWIDFDNNRSFDQSEEIMLGINSGTQLTSNFTVPTNVSAGDTVRMRLRLSYFGSPSNCGNQFGEVEDHLIFLRSVATSIEEPNKDKLLTRIVPNPTKESFTIEFASQVEDVQLSIFNSVGQLILQKQLGDGNRFLINENLESGIYLIRLESSLGIHNNRLIIQE